MHIFRVTPGKELVESISDYCQSRGINGGVVTGIIGSLNNVSLGFLKELPGKYITREFAGPLEIAASQGSVGICGDERVIHIHMTISDEHGAVGGHLVSGEVFSTAEVIIKELQDCIARRTDDYTGLKELSD